MRLSMLISPSAMMNKRGSGPGTRGTRTLAKSCQIEVASKNLPKVVDLPNFGLIHYLSPNSVDFETLSEVALCSTKVNYEMVKGFSARAKFDCCLQIKSTAKQMWRGQLGAP